MRPPAPTPTSRPCTRAGPGAEGGACATGRQCDTGLMCCDSKPLMGGLTEPMAPTCQRAAACPNIPPQCLRMWASVYEEQRSLLMGERDPANACTATMTACMKGCQEAMYKVRASLQSCGAWLALSLQTTAALVVCQLKLTTCLPASHLPCAAGIRVCGRPAGCQLDVSSAVPMPKAAGRACASYLARCAAAVQPYLL